MARKKTSSAPKRGEPYGTTPRQFRFTQEDLDMIDDLARLWGGTMQPMKRASVLRETLRRVHRAEFEGRKKI